MTKKITLKSKAESHFQKILLNFISFSLLPRHQNSQSHAIKKVQNIERTLVTIIVNAAYVQQLRTSNDPFSVGQPRLRFRSYFRFDSDDRPDCCRRTQRRWGRTRYEPIRCHLCASYDAQSNGVVIRECYFAREAGNLTDNGSPRMIVAVFEKRWKWSNWKEYVNLFYFCI